MYAYIHTTKDVFEYFVNLKYYIHAHTHTKKNIFPYTRICIHTKIQIHAYKQNTMDISEYIVNLAADKDAGGLKKDGLVCVCMYVCMNVCVNSLSIFG